MIQLIIKIKRNSLIPSDMVVPDMVVPDMVSPDMVPPDRGSVFLYIYIDSKLGHSKSGFATLSSRQ